MKIAALQANYDCTENTNCRACVGSMVIERTEGKRNFVYKKISIIFIHVAQ
jgi:hypothetical protein